MDARFYNSEDIDIERLASDLVSAYQSQGYKAQQIGNRDQVLVQIKKGGDFEAILGMQAVLSVTIQRTSGGVLALIGQQRWVDKAAVGAVGIAVLPLLWPLAVTAGVGAIRQASLGNQVLNMVDGLVRQQRPGVSGGPVPSQFAPQVQRQWEALPPPQAPISYYLPSGQSMSSQPGPQAASGQLRCVQCNTPYEPGDTFCSGCGRPLTARKVHCPNCNSELKQGLSFCSKCGTSTFQSLSPAQQTGSAPGVQMSPPSPVSQTPFYTPPPPPLPQPQIYYNDKPTVSTSSNTASPQQPWPETPVYTPPARPAEPTPVYYVPPQPTSNDKPAVSASNTAQQQSPPPYYVPPQPTSNDKPTVSASNTAQQQSAMPYYVPSPSAPQESSATSYYVPPVPQDPPVKPEPKVTIIQSTPKQEPLPPKSRPQTQYYIPSNQGPQPTVHEHSADTQQAMPASFSPITQHQAQTQPSGPVVARPISRPLTAPNIIWGLLTFSDGQQIQLVGERVVVGRYDHDLDGVPPEVDLGQMQGADTVSRMHAVLEHIGSAATLTDLNSTNATRLNGKRLEPDKAMPISSGNTLQFGKITCTFEKAS